MGTLLRRIYVEDDPSTIYLLANYTIVLDTTDVFPMSYSSDTFIMSIPGTHFVDITCLFGDDEFSISDSDPFIFSLVQPRDSVVPTDSTD